MTIYNTTARGVTNFFKVKDISSFKEFICNFSFCKINIFYDQREKCKVGLFFEEFNDGCFGFPEYDNDDNEIDFAIELSKHLQKGEVAILTSFVYDSIGIENRPRLFFSEIAVDHNGNKIISDNFIDKVSKKFKVCPDQLK